MKYNTLKSGYLLVFLFGMMIISMPKSYAQIKHKVYFYSKLIVGYGNVFDRFDVTTPGQSGPITAKHRESHGNGLNLDISIGGTISKSKNVSKYSYFDIFALHRQLFSPEAFFSFTGGGLQIRHLWTHANLVLGYANNSDEIANRRDQQNIIGYGKMSGFAYGFGLGISSPRENRSPLIFVWDINALFPRSPYDDLTGYLHFTWFSTSLGITYYISQIR